LKKKWASDPWSEFEEKVVVHGASRVDMRCAQRCIGSPLVGGAGRLVDGRLSPVVMFKK
jgi:hypothetical protein